MRSFQYYGGKNSKLNFILPNLPQCHCFVDVFGGSAAVLLNKKQSPIEVYNDLDSDVVNFFKVLRHNHEELIRRLELTPYSREEFVSMLDRSGDISDMERARRFFSLAYMGYVGKHKLSAGNFGYSKVKSSGGRALVVNAFRNATKSLDEVRIRMSDVIIENLSFNDIIPRYDTGVTLFYCDPPYVKIGRTNSKEYKKELTKSDHILLSQLLRGIEGRAAVSAYRCDLYDDLYHDWHRVDNKPHKLGGTRAKDKTLERTEVMYLNYRFGFDDLPIFNGGA